MNCKLMISGITLAALVSLSCPSAWARQEGQDLQILTGQVRTRSSQGKWVDGPASGLTAGDQVETGPEGGAILSLEDGARLRLGPDTRLEVGNLGQNQPFRLSSGRVFGLMPAHSGGSLLLQGPDARVQCSTGTFVYSVHDQASQLRVLTGDATVRGTGLRLAVASESLPAPALKLGPGMLALTGPDIIDRTKSDVTVPVDQTQPDQNELPPPPAPPPPVPVPPAPPPAVPPPQPPPPTSQVEEHEGGLNPLFLLLGLGGAGALIALLVGGGGNNNVPVSP